MSTTLIVIDMQESFRRSPDWAQVSDPGVVGRVGALVGAARDGGHGVVWVLHANPGSGGPFDPAEGDVRLMGEFAPAPDEPVLTKTSRNAFTTTRLGQHLTASGVGEVVICGIQTEQCCETTARVAARRNGADPQESAMLRHRNHLDDLVHRAQDLIDARFDERLPLAWLAASLAVSERTLTRAFARSIGMSPLRYQRLLRLERARALIAAGATAEAAAREAGFSDARMLRRLRAGSTSGPYASAR